MPNIDKSISLINDFYHVTVMFFNNKRIIFIITTYVISIFVSHNNSFSQVLLLS